MLSHHMVIREGKIANYQPYPPTPWNGNPRDYLRDARARTRTRCRTRRSSRRTGPDNFKGVDIMRAVHSFDPCLPCGVHMYGQGQGPQGGAHADRDVLMAAASTGPGAHRAPRGARRPCARECADELAAAIVRSTARASSGSSRRSTTSRRAARRGRGRREPAADPRPVPGDLETRVREALDEVRPYMESHGGDVELLGIEDGVARLRLDGQLRRLRGVGRDARAAIEAGARGGRARPRGLEVEGVVERPRARRRRSPPTRRGSTLDGAAGLAARARSCGRERAAWSRTSAGRCSPTATAARAAARALRRRCCSGGTLTLPALRRGVRPAARRARARRRRAAARAGAAAARRRRGPVALSGASRRAPARERRGATCELCPIGIGEDHRHLLHLDERRIVCVCETCWSLRSGDAEFRPPGARTRAGSTTSSCPTSCGRRSRSRSASRSSCARASRGGVVALYPSPAGATESELDLDGVGRAVRREPGARPPRARRRGADRQPARRRRRSTRSRRSTTATGSSASSRRAGRASPAGAASRRRSPSSSTSCARGGRGERVEAAPARHRARVLGARRRAGRARGGADAALPRCT